MGCDLSPLQVLAEFPELPYVPFGQESPSMNAELRDVGEERARRQNLSISQKYHIVESYEKRDGRRTAVATPLVRRRPRGGDGKRRNVPTA